MKANKFMAIVMMACTILAVGCKKDEGGSNEPDIKKTTPDVAATEGATTVVWNIANIADVCDEVGFVFAGNYNGYSVDDVDAMVHFKALEGYEGWYVAVIPLETVDHLEGKPCALKKDGTFPSDWAYQWFDQEDHPCEIISGAASFVTENGNETKLVCEASADVVYVKSYGFKSDPCVDAVYYDVTFNLTVETPVTEGGTVYIVGDAFEKSWDQTAYPMTGSGSNWTITLPAIVGKEYKFCVNADWANDQMVYDAEKACVKKADNMKVDFTTMEPTVYGFLNFGITEEQVCKEEVVEGVMYIKCAGNGWTWQQMTVDPADNTKFTFESTVADAGNVGANIGVSDAAEGQWYDLGTADANGLAAGDDVVYTFVSTEGATGTLTVAKK